MDRRTFIITIGGLLAFAPAAPKNIMTVRGPIRANRMGPSLVHEHFLVDFIGADKTGPQRWNRAAVIAKVLPYLLEAKGNGVRTIVDCTPAFLGRDAVLLQELSEKSGLQVVTNTGYYGAVNNKYLPPWAFSETAPQLAARWVAEYKHGIEGTGIRPGFIKISVDAKEPLSDMHRKLVQAAALTHLRTGLTIYSHTGLANAAFQQLEILRKERVHASAFVWVHAQSEKDFFTYVRAARRGAWISLDGMGWGGWDDYAAALVLMKKEKLLHKVLISHDAGWYKPDEPDASFQGFTAIFTKLFPRLEAKGFSNKDLDQLMVDNPAAALSLTVRKL